MAAAPSPHDDHAAPNSSTSYFTYPVRYAVSGVLRRLSTDPHASTPASSSPTSPHHLPASRPRTPPYNPPPLTPLSLHGLRSSGGGDGGASSSRASPSQILSRLVAEEIRLLVPPRLQLVDTWRLVFSLEQHGASLGTLYRRCADLAARRAGFVLVVQDSAGGVRSILSVSLSRSLPFMHTPTPKEPRSIRSTSADRRTFRFVSQRRSSAPTSTTRRAPRTGTTTARASASCGARRCSPRRSRWRRCCRRRPARTRRALRA